MRPTVRILLPVIPVLLFGCADEQQVEVESSDSPRWDSPAPLPADFEAADDSGQAVEVLENTDPAPATGQAVMAKVNGQTLYMAPLHEMLVRQSGLELARQMVANELVRQRADELGIEITEADIQAEQAEALSRIFPPDITGEQRKGLLGQFLQQRGLTETQWRLTMARNARLAKIAAAQVRVTDQMLQAAFAAQYDRKVVVRHMQLPSMVTASLVRKNLLSGVDFAATARAKSIGPTASGGGLLPAFARNDPSVHPDLRAAAHGLGRVGQISEILQIGKSFHLLKLEKIIEPEQVKLEDVKEELTRQVRDAQVDKLKQTILTRLYAAAVAEGRVRFVDPTLRELNQRQTDSQTDSQTGPSGSEP